MFQCSRKLSLKNLSNGEAVAPQAFTLIGGQENQFEVEHIVNYSPKAAHKNGKLRKANELPYWVKWLGMAYGTDGRQPYTNVKLGAQEASQDLATRINVEPDTFAKGGNRVPLPESSFATSP